jgi:hypothetical protein
MPLYQLTDRSGNKIQVEGPSGATKEQIVSIYNNTIEQQNREPERRLRAGLENYYGTKQEVAGDIARRRKPTVGDYFGEIPKGLIGGAAGMVESGALGLAALLPEDAENVVRDGIKAVGGAVQDYVVPDFNLEESIPRKVSEATGSFVGLAGTTMLNPIAGAGLAVSAGAGEASERARAEGASVEDRSLAAALGVIPGALELLPIKFLSVINKAQKKNITDALVRIVEQGGIEAGQEAVSSIAQNLIAREVYKPDQSLVEGTGEESALGGTVGAIVQGTLELVTPRTRGGTTGGVDTDTDTDTETLALPSPEAGIAGLLPAPPKQLADQRTSLGNAQARADIGRMIDSTGDITLGEMEDIVARTGISLPDLEIVVSEEMEKRGGALAQRAQAEIEDELTTPTVERDPSIVTQAVANKLDPQGEARKREEQAALERDDVAAFEQPDLLAAELEAERKASPEAAARDAARRNAQESQEPAVENVEGVRKFDAAQPDLLDLLAQQDNATVRRARAEAQETDLAARAAAPQVKIAQEAPFRQGAERRKAVVDAVLAKSATGSVVNTEKAIQKALAAAGMPRTVLTRNEKLAAKNKAAEFKQANRPTAFAPDTANEEQFVVPAEEIKKTPKGITPLVKPTSIPTDIPKLDAPTGGKPDVKNLDPRAGGISPASNRRGGANDRNGGVSSTGKPTTLDNRRVGSPVLGDGVIGDGATPRRNTLGGKATPKGAKRGPIPAGIKGVARPKPKESEAKQVARLYKEETPAEVKAVFGGKQEIPTTNPFGDPDNKKIKNKILQGSTKSDKSKKEDAPVVAYLRAYPNPFDGLSMALYDQINATPLAKQATTYKDKKGNVVKDTDAANKLDVKARKSMGGTPTKKGELSSADRAVAWARANLSKEANEKLDRRAREIQLNQVRTVVFEGGPDRVMDAYEKGILQDRKSLEAAIVGGYADPKELVKDYPDLYPNKAAVEKAMDDPSFGRMALDLGAVVGLDIPMNPAVVEAVEKGDLGDVLSNVARTNPVRQIQELARRFAAVAGDTKLVVKKNLKAEDGRSVAGLFDPKTNTILLDADTGINTHTIMHEMSHAGMSASLADPKSAFARDTKKLFKDIQGYLGSAYGAQDVDEFLAEAMSNPEFRSDLASINIKGEPVTALQRLRNIMQNFFSKFVPSIKSTNITALQQVDALVDGLLAPAPQYRNANQMAMMTTADGVKKFAKEAVQATQKSINADSRKQFGYNARDFLTEGFSKKSKNLLLKLTGLQGLGDIAQSVGLGRMGFKLDELVANQRGEIQTANKIIERKIGDILTTLGKGTPEAAQKRKEALDRLIYSNDYGATIYQVDPTKPKGAYINKDGSPRMDNDGNDLLEVWNAQRADWNAMGKDGQKAYNDMRAVYKDQYDKLKAVVLKQIDELVQDPDASAKLKKDIFAKLFDSSKLDVYFPLMREGDYVLRYEVKNPKSAREASVVQTFTTAAEREDAAKQFRANKDYKNVEIVDEVTANTFRGTGVDPSFAYDTLNILESKGVDKDVRDQILKLFLNSLPETSFAKSLQKRKGTPGYMQDSVYALKTKGYSLASQTAKLKYGALLRQYEQDLKEFQQVAVPEAKSVVGKSAKTLTAAFEDVKAELQNRAEFARKGADKKNLEEVARRLNQTAFIYTIGFNASSALVNLSQIPLFVAPFLGGRYGYTKTYSAIKAAYGNTLLGGTRGGGTNSILDFYDISDKGNFTLKKGLKLPEGKEAELRNMEALVQTASKRGLLGQGFLAEAMGLNETSRIKKGGKIGNAVDNASVLSAWLFNHAEQLNRQVTLMASFNLALDSVTKGKTKNPSAAQIEEAVQMAIYDTQQTNGGTFLETAPSIAREGIGRVAFMYKNYGLQMYYTMLKTAKTAMDSDKGKLFGKEGSPERKAAVKQLIGMHGSALFFAGIQGLPLYGAVKLIANLFFLDDEEADFDTLTRQYFGEGWYKGAITEFAGIDVASRMALTGLLIQENRFNNDPSLEETIGFYVGGPALSVANRLYRGGSDLLSSEGDIERGIENILPAGVANAYKASFGRYADQGGAFTRRQDPIYDDMTGGELVAQALGFPPTEYTFRQEQNSISKGIDIAVGKRRSALHKKLYIAQRMGDFDEEMALYDKIDKFNERHPEAAITPKSIKRSLEQHAKTSAEMYNGVTLSPLYRNALEMLRDGYKQ